MDVTQFDDAKRCLLELAEEMGGMDILVLNAGISDVRKDASTKVEQKVIDVNVSGFVQLFNTAYRYFIDRGRGQIVGISSVAGLLGYGRAPTYHASKAFISNYMQGYRQKSRRTQPNIAITDLKPGYIESEMTEGQQGMFWVAPADKGTRQILRAIEKRRHHSYITRRWRLVGWLVKLVPDWVVDRV